MDPLSLSASCVGLIAAVTKTSLTVTSFVREVRDARRDLDAISRELSSLKNVLELLAEDTDGQKGTLPTSLESQITGMLTNCNGVVTEIENGLAKASKSKFGKAGYWTLGGGQSDMAKLRSSLEAYKSALEISLDMVTITITRDIKKDTTEILCDTAAIKDDTAQILQEIARLQERLPAAAPHGDSDFVLQRYLDTLTTYAETVYDPVADDSVGSSRPASPVALASDVFGLEDMKKALPSVSSSSDTHVGETVSATSKTSPGNRQGPAIPHSETSSGTSAADTERVREIFDFLRTQPQALQLREAIQRQPAMLEPVLRQFGAVDPKVGDIIHSHMDQFLELFTEEMKPNQDLSLPSNRQPHGRPHSPPRVGRSQPDEALYSADEASRSSPLPHDSSLAMDRNILNDAGKAGLGTTHPAQGGTARIPFRDESGWQEEPSKRAKSGTRRIEKAYEAGDARRVQRGSIGVDVHSGNRGTPDSDAYPKQEEEKRARIRAMEMELTAQQEAEATIRPGIADFPHGGQGPRRVSYYPNGFTAENYMNEPMMFTLPERPTLGGPRGTYRYTALSAFPSDPPNALAGFKLWGRGNIDIIIAVNVNGFYFNFDTNKDLSTTLNNIKRELTAVSDECRHRIVVCVLDSRVYNKVDDEFRREAQRAPQPRYFEEMVGELLGVKCDASQIEGIKDVEIDTRVRNGFNTAENKWLPTKYRGKNVGIHLFECMSSFTHLGQPDKVSDAPSQINVEVQFLWVQHSLSGYIEPLLNDIGSLFEARSCIFIDSGYELPALTLPNFYNQRFAPYAHANRDKKYAGMPTMFWPSKKSSLFASAFSKKGPTDFAKMGKSMATLMSSSWRDPVLGVDQSYPRRAGYVR